MVLTFEFLDETPSREVRPFKWKQLIITYASVVLFIMLYKVVLTFESVDEIQKCDIQMKAPEQYFPVVLFIMLFKAIVTFAGVFGWNRTMKAIEQYFPVVLFIMLHKVILAFESLDKLLKCDHSNESYLPVGSCGTVFIMRDKAVLTFEFVDKILKCVRVIFSVVCPQTFYFFLRRSYERESETRARVRRLIIFVLALEKIERLWTDYVFPESSYNFVCDVYWLISV